MGYSVGRTRSDCDIASMKKSTYEFLWALVDILVQIALILILAVICAALWAFALLIPPSRCFDPFQWLLSLIWNAYDIGTVQGANAQIVVANPEYRSSNSFQNTNNPELDC